MEKTAAHWGASSNMHAIGAVFEHAGLFGTKTWGHTPRGSTPIMIVWDAESGRLRAIIEAMALGQMRTGAMSGIGTRWMSDPAADDLAVIGSGKQALTQVAAVAAVRDLRRIRVFSPTAERRMAFGEKLKNAFPKTQIVVANELSRAVEGASIITLITRARESFLTAEMVSHGAHINAAGAITRERKEFAQDIFRRAQLVAVDTIPTVQQLSAEFIEWYGSENAPSWSAVQRISDLVASGHPRPSSVDISLFKAMGMGISDLSVASEVIRRAEELGVGRVVPHPEPVAPRSTNHPKTESAA
jgi:alanine dehydrogenase